MCSKANSCIQPNAQCAKSDPASISAIYFTVRGGSGVVLGSNFPAAQLTEPSSLPILLITTWPSAPGFVELAVIAAASSTPSHRRSGSKDLYHGASSTQEDATSHTAGHPGPSPTPMWIPTRDASYLERRGSGSWQGSPDENICLWLHQPRSNSDIPTSSGRHRGIGSCRVLVDHVNGLLS